MVEFAGWEMPLTYGSIIAEHRAVRQACGLFDVSHMGEIEIRGRRAAELCQELTVNDVRRLRDGGAQYTLLCNPAGGILDDLILYRLSPQRFLLCVNAATTANDLQWVREHAYSGTEVIDRSAELALLAVQGPLAAAVLARLTAADLASQPPLTCREVVVGGIEVLLARSGYTGEDGFELFAAADKAASLWEGLLEVVRGRGGLPAGLGARDTLRLEAGLLLYGVDMGPDTSPFEAGLGWVVKLDKGDFVGRERLLAQKQSGLKRHLVGLELLDPAVPRHGYPVWHGEERVGEITSGARSPTLGSFIGLGYVRTGAHAVGTQLKVEVRGRRLRAKVVARPFYRRAAK